MSSDSVIETVLSILGGSLFTAVCLLFVLSDEYVKTIIWAAVSVMISTLIFGAVLIIFA